MSKDASGNSCGKRGNDNQQFLSLALHLLQLEPGTTATIDNQIDRGKHMLYPPPILSVVWPDGLQHSLFLCKLSMP